MFNMEEHMVEGVTYEIVDVVDATYARLANPDEESHAADVEYLELDMEVVEAVSDAAEYFSNADDSQEDKEEEEHAIVKQQPSQKVQQLINVNGNQCFSIKREKNLSNGNDEKRKRKASEASFSDNSLYINQGCDTEKSKEQIKKSECDSLDLFFQSMAQTVLHLPPRVQAKIKMDICKVIAMAEIKYCSITAHNNNSNNKNNNSSNNNNNNNNNNNAINN